ncbi:unnamed protein product [Rotaria magnacalcarata]|uniref:UBC core domain-containing protein n=1 Tax=Rotaria magnacalcarata TaxID=392030 RepID=A0A816NSX3_9BILA|nr:unnamed protein product [Rotaria magnacalcarata]CAF4189391.1 unnamed protein product [Rotaria magnacalcarata]
MTHSGFLSRRLFSEIDRLRDDPDLKMCFHFEDNENYDSRIINGHISPRSFPYKYGSFKVKIILPMEYPLRMSGIEFLTPIYHLQIKSRDNKFFGLCCDGCEDWRPTTTLSQLIKTVVSRTNQTDATAISKPKNLDAYQHYVRDKDDYWKTVMNMIEKHACRRTDEPIISLKFMTKRIIRKQIGYDSEKINQLSLSISLQQYLQIPFDPN